MRRAAHTLDVRGLPAPEPLEQCLDALAELETGQQLRLLIDREPYPLYRILERDGFRYDCRNLDTHFQVDIEAASSPAASVPQSDRAPDTD